MVINLDAKTRVRPVTSKDRNKIASLIHFETSVHRHLDWQSPLEWIDHEPYYLLEKSGKILAALACPPDPPGVSWIRLFAVSFLMDELEAWKQLWQAVKVWLERNGQMMVAAIPLQNWFRDLLEDTGFEYNHDVIMLAWDRSEPNDKKESQQVHIRPMGCDDLADVESVDQAAFPRLWRNSLPALENAYRQAAVATLAEIDGKIVAYQISTSTAMGGHLARLAVHPQSQGQGVGSALVLDLLDMFTRRGVSHVTVNTQGDNHASIALYRGLGFRHTGEVYPVYEWTPAVLAEPED